MHRYIKHHVGVGKLTWLQPAFSQRGRRGAPWRGCTRVNKTEMPKSGQQRAPSERRTSSAAGLLF